LAGALTDNLGLKIFSLLASIMLFSIVHSDQDAKRWIFVDLVAIEPPADSGKMLISGIPHQVKVKVSGSQSRISALQRDDIDPIQMDLTDTNRRYYHFEPRSLSVPGSIQVVEFSPATVVLTWADLGQRTVPVRPRLRGEPEKGFQLLQPVTLDPPTVTLSGPQQELSSITAVYTDMIMLDGLGEGVHEPRIPLEPLPEHVSHVEDIDVRVRLEVHRNMADRTIRRLEVAVVGEREATLRPPEVAVTIRGPEVLIARFNPEHLIPTVSLDMDASVGTQPRQVELRGLPDGLEVTEISPPSVLATVGK
jgi:YbbR domain-containing protein